MNLYVFLCRNYDVSQGDYHHEGYFKGDEEFQTYPRAALICLFESQFYNMLLLLNVLEFFSSPLIRFGSKDIDLFPSLILNGVNLWKPLSCGVSQCFTSCLRLSSPLP